MCFRPAQQPLPFYSIILVWGTELEEPGGNGNGRWGWGVRDRKRASDGVTAGGTVDDTALSPVFILQLLRSRS